MESKKNLEKVFLFFPQGSRTERPLSSSLNVERVLSVQMSVHGAKARQHFENTTMGRRNGTCVDKVPGSPYRQENISLSPLGWGLTSQDRSLSRIHMDSGSNVPGIKEMAPCNDRVTYPVRNGVCIRSDHFSGDTIMGYPIGRFISVQSTALEEE